MIPFKFPIRYTLGVLAVILSLNSQAYVGDINQVDANGQRQGYWVITGYMAGDKAYRNEAVVEEGIFKDSKKEGIWKKYWPNGKMRSEINYAQGRPSGSYKLFYDNGVKEEEGNWVNNRNTGNFKRFHPNGNPQQDFQFSDNGKRNGWQKYYHENGKIAMEVNIVNGVESGLCKIYNTDGSLAEEKVYEKGAIKPESVKKYKAVVPAPAKADPYDETLGKESVATKDKTNKAVLFSPDGYNVLYNAAGQVTQTGDFKKGKLFNGKVYRYNGDGLLIKVEIYKKGKYVGNGVITEGDM